jgi:hypothetical protein
MKGVEAHDKLPARRCGVEESAMGLKANKRKRNISRDMNIIRRE